MKMKLITLVVCMTLAISVPARAAWVDFQTVQAIHTSGNQIHFKTNTYDPNSPCVWQNTWVLEKSHVQFEEIYKMLMVAFLTGRSGQVAGTGQCVGSGNQKQITESFLLGTW